MLSKKHVTILVQQSPKLKWSGGDSFSFKEPKFSMCMELMERVVMVTPNYFTWKNDKCKWFVTNILLYFRLMETTDTDIVERIVKELATLNNRDIVEFPYEILCPITQCLMIEPVIAEDNHTYEKSAIKKALKKKPESPLTRQPIGNKFVENTKVTELISQQLLTFKFIVKNPKTNKLEASTIKMYANQSFVELYGASGMPPGLYFANDKYEDISEMNALRHYSRSTIVYCFVIDENYPGGKNFRIYNSNITLYDFYTIMDIYSILYDIEETDVSYRAIDVMMKYGKMCERTAEPESCIKYKNAAGDDFDQIYVGDFNFTVNPGFTWKNAIESFGEICEHRFPSAEFYLDFYQLRTEQDVLDKLAGCVGKGIIVLIAFTNLISDKVAYQIRVDTACDFWNIYIRTPGAPIKYYDGDVTKTTELLRIPDEKINTLEFGDYRIKNISDYKMQPANVKKLIAEYSKCCDPNDIQLHNGDIQIWFFYTEACFNGKSNTEFAEVEVRIYFHVDWPEQPPVVHIHGIPNKLKHPNIYNSGKMCLSPWKPNTAISQLIAEVRETLVCPSIEKIVDIDAWIQMCQMQTNKTRACKK